VQFTGLAFPTSQPHIEAGRTGHILSENSVQFYPRIQVIKSRRQLQQLNRLQVIIEPAQQQIKISSLSSGRALAGDDSNAVANSRCGDDQWRQCD